VELEDLEIYKLAREISREAWDIYNKLDWQDKKTMGDQWISAVDSIGANIAEGFGRFHYLDKNKFSYNARGSLLESLHWANLLEERGKITKEESESLKTKLQILHLKLNNYIKSTKHQLNKTTQ
jgi:four helix bundle protein